MFKSNVRKFNDGLKEKINSIAHGIINQCIADPLVPTMVDGHANYYICET
jgi:hypothetical protein